MLESNKNAVTVIYSGGDVQVPFLFYDVADLVVLVETTMKTMGKDYTVTGAGNTAGGKVVFLIPPVDGERVTVIRKVEFTQLLSIPPNGIIPEGALSKALDRIVMMIQQLAEQAGRAVTYPEGTEKGEVANAGEMLNSIEKARTDINNAVTVAGTTLDTANQKLGEINTVSSATLQEITEQQQRTDEAITKVEDAAARAQSLPLGHVIHGFWKSAPSGTLALRMAQWPIASFPDLFQMAVDAGIAIPKETYDAIKAAKGSVGFFGIDEDGVSFWTPHLEDIAVAPASPGMVGFETGDINLASLPEITGSFRSSTDIGTTYGEQNYEGAFKLGAFCNNVVTYSSSNGYAIDFQASLSDDTYGRDGDSEVRTKRMHFLYCVVAYHEARPVAVADMAAMLASIAQLQAYVQELQTVPLDYACIIKGASTGAPNEVQDDNLGGTDGLVTSSSRYILANPFGADTPVLVKAEVFVNNMWSDSGFSSSSGDGFGTQANYVQGVGIVVQTGDSRPIARSTLGGGGHNLDSSLTSVRCRVQIWRVKR